MPRIIVHEPEPLFAAELQRLCQSDASCEVEWQPHAQHVVNNLADVVLVMLRIPIADSSLEFLQRLRRRTAARLVVLVSHENSAWELLLREFGADAILPETAPKSRIHELVRLRVSSDSPAAN